MPDGGDIRLNTSDPPGVLTSPPTAAATTTVKPSAAAKVAYTTLQQMSSSKHWSSLHSVIDWVITYIGDPSHTLQQGPEFIQQLSRELYALPYMPYTKH